MAKGASSGAKGEGIGERRRPGTKKPARDLSLAGLKTQLCRSLLILIILTPPYVKDYFLISARY